MRKTKLILLVLLTLILVDKTVIAQNSCSKEQKHIIVGYITGWSEGMPDPTYLTHINYAFGHITDTFDGIRIDNEEKLKALSLLKTDYPHLKLLLSIGGWGSGFFSEMSADQNLRKAFAKDCQRVIEEFDLDGIDIDWEYPTSSMAEISSSPQDAENYNLLMSDIRAEIGINKLLTLASAASADYIDFKGLMPFVDFVNIMSYDMGTPPYHHSALYQSEHTRFSVDQAVKAHQLAGIPNNKLVVGLPFYGRFKSSLGNAINYKNIIELNDYEYKWDEVAQSPYLIDQHNNFVGSYDNPKSILLKCQYIKDNGLLGAMYWEYSGDDSQDTLKKAVHDGINKY